MTPTDFVEQLYRDFDWRFNEVRRLQNIITREGEEAARDELRKSLIVVLYAHFEGFCVFSLEHYLTAMNQASITCGSAAPAIIAGAFERVFNAMEHGDQKCKVFSKSLPNDAGLHRHWRRRHFIEEFERLLERRVAIPNDVIDAESNLKPDVLRRNLFILGLDHTFVDPYADAIHNLLARRNRIAHGEDRRPVQLKEYSDYEGAVFEICYHLIEFLDEAYRGERYLRPVPEYAV
ncbi:MAG TPA: MAE_28990/MAE_18760 family HEPN-like nuclease [Xanthobacteraceae bacterium]|jgi:hypothetical protein